MINTTCKNQAPKGKGTHPGQRNHKLKEGAPEGAAIYLLDAEQNSKQPAGKPTKNLNKSYHLKERTTVLEKSYPKKLETPKASKLKDVEG